MISVITIRRSCFVLSVLIVRKFLNEPEEKLISPVGGFFGGLDGTCEGLKQAQTKPRVYQRLEGGAESVRRHRVKAGPQPFQCGLWRL